MKSKIKELKAERKEILKEMEVVNRDQYYNNWEAEYVSISVGCALQEDWAELNNRLNAVEKQIDDFYKADIPVVVNGKIIKRI